MMKWMKQQRGIVSLAIGMITVFVGYLAWGLLTLCHKSGSFGTAGFFFSILTMLFYALFGHSLAEHGENELIRQFRPISAVGMLICLLLFFRGGGALFLQREYMKLALDLLWLVTFAGCCFCLGNKGLPHLDGRMGEICRKGSCHKYFCILLAGTVLFLIEPNAVQFKWDGLLYYQAVQDTALDSISSLALYGHIAQTYGMLNSLASLIVGNTAVAMISMNIFIFLCSICAFYGLMRCMIPGKCDWTYGIVTAIYAWSPFTLGMVFYHNLDFYCQCFFVIMLYFLYRRQWIYFFVTSLLFCFTKEPAILIYGMLCIGIVILDFVDQTGQSFRGRLGKLLRTKQYYFMVLPGILWLATYKILGPWSGGVGGFYIDGAYVIEKLKALYVFQFNWLFTILCIGGAVFCIAKREKKVWCCIFPVLCGQIAFTVFSCLFKTVNHPRYNGASQPALYCMAILFTAFALEHLCAQIVAGGISVLLAVSSFYTIDPVTRLCFPVYSMGNADIVTTDKTLLGDGMIYNRQMLWLEHALGMALEDSLRESDIVFFPALEGSTYFFDGMAETAAVDSDYWSQSEYWDIVERRRVTAPGDGVQIFSAVQLAEELDWDKLGEEFTGRINYCYLSCAGERRAEEIRERFHVLEEEAYTYRGWTVYRICFE